MPPQLCEISSEPDSYRLATLTPDPSRTLCRQTLPVTHSATSSPESADGRSHCAWPEFQTMSLFGRQAPHANLSARKARELGLLTSGTYGRSTSISSASAALAASSASRLKQLLTTGGSTLFALTWKEKVSPSGFMVSLLRASAPRTTDRASSGRLPTPSGTSNHGVNHVAGRLDEWGGSSNPFRGTSLGRVHCPAFEFWVMGYPETWTQLMPPAMPSCRRSRRDSSRP